MASEYSRVVAFSGNSDAIQTLELPAPSYGVLDRVIITQTSPVGTLSSAIFKIYDRRSACIGLTDINVESSGTVSSIGNSATGVLTITFSAPHNLKEGVSFFIKDCTVSAYNTTYVVASVVSTTSITVLSTISASSATSGVWQTLPFNPRTSPPTSLIYSGTVVAGETFQGFNLDRAYENKDNQDINLRSRHTGLWLEFSPEDLAYSPGPQGPQGPQGSAEPVVLAWEIAYTCRTNPFE